MQPQVQVLVELAEGSTVPGLLLKRGRDGQDALVTYEHDGRVETAWVPLQRVRPLELPD
jgi:hypothetical protein